jgi:hypothetical protein
MSVADLTERLTEAEEAFMEALMSLLRRRMKRGGGEDASIPVTLMYLTEEWDAWRKKREADNNFGGSAIGGGAGKGHGHGVMHQNFKFWNVTKIH